MELDRTLIKDQIKLLIGPCNIAMAFKLYELDDPIHPMDNQKEIASVHQWICRIEEIDNSFFQCLTH